MKFNVVKFVNILSVIVIFTPFMLSPLSNVHAETVEEQVAKDTSESDNLGLKTFDKKQEVGSIEEVPPVETKDRQESASTAIPKVAETAETNELENEEDEAKENISGETVTTQEIQVDTRIESRINGVWGSVPWTWDGSTRTIILQGGTAGSVPVAPWKTYTNVTKIVVENKVVLLPDASQLFMDLQHLERIEQANNLDTSNVTNMHVMFNRASSLTELDVSNWNTSRVYSMMGMFNGASSLTELDVSNWNTWNVSNMSRLFNGASSLTELDMSNWNTRSWLRNADNMFTGATNLSKLHLGERSRFDHLGTPPSMPGIAPSNDYTGNWVYYLNQSGTIPEEYLAPSSSNFWREYDGSNPGTYSWQTKGTVVVNYRDHNDQEIAAPLTITDGIRAPFRIEEKEIEGYTLTEIPSNTSGRFKEEKQMVIFRYRLDGGYPVDPLNPEVEVDPENKPELPEDQGGLSIDFVSSFNFGTQVISVQNQTYYAQPQRLLNEDGTVNEEVERPNYIQISDRRPENERNGWQLAVTQTTPMTGEDGQVLAGAQLGLANQELISVQPNAQRPSLQLSNPITLVPGNRRTLLRAEGTEGLGTWIYRFGNQDSAQDSITLTVPGSANPDATSYATTLVWELSVIPEN
ncbi:WxL domain-containing protein [Enterococcus casseliflavus]|uniref:WxL domain-containing protein n=1 Tax=Enterococcus casseliflavus TaxID=37734 RepID=UPI002DBEC269|nr:WxL domain-containing protein [Enterococcus casseliflavus]MEB8401539.1 WxL domain-containing protein [Enterococcus casseliflavus]